MGARFSIIIVACRTGNARGRRNGLGMRMRAAMSTPLPPPAEKAIQRAYRFAMALQTCQVDTADVRAAMLITMDEAFALLDCARSGPWEVGAWAPNRQGRPPRRARYDLNVEPEPGMAWARLFGVTLIIESDVMPPFET
jgi:hypothetical protein